MNFSINGTNLPEVDRNFYRLQQDLLYVQQVVRYLVDASAGAQNFYLPDGTATPQTKDYYWQKVDSSFNTVTIYPFGTQTIQGAASYSLGAQYNRVRVTWSPATREWVIV